MKKILLPLLVLLTVAASAQTPLPGSTTINSRYQWLGGKFQQLKIPMYADTTQYPLWLPRVGGDMMLDTAGADQGVIYVRYNMYWHGVSGNGGSSDTSGYKYFAAQYPLVLIGGGDTAYLSIDTAGLNNIDSLRLQATGYYYPEDYGAKPNDGTDDTPGIQAAINAAFAAGGGNVFFHNGIWNINGDFITSLDGVSTNCQLYIPLTTESGTGRAIRLLGQTPPATEHSVLIDFPANTTGAILLSNKIGTGTNPSIFGASYYFSSFSSPLNFTDVYVENLTLRARSKTGSTHIANNMTGFNFITLGVAHFNNVRVDAESKVNESLQPTQGAGIYLPGINNSADVSVDNVLVAGYESGIVANEHATGDNIKIAGTVKGIVYNQMNHPTHFNRVLLNGVKYGIWVAGDSYLTIDQLATEHYNGSFGAKWYTYVNDVYLAAGSAKGNIRFFIVTSSVGPDNGSFSSVNIDPNSLQCAPLGETFLTRYNQFIWGLKTFYADNPNPGQHKAIMRNINPAGDSRWEAWNNLGNSASIGVTGSSFVGLDHLSNAGAVLSNTGLRRFNFITDADLLNTGNTPFVFMPGGYDSTRERMRITPSGIGIGGVVSPSAMLHLYGTARMENIGSDAGDTTTYKPFSIDASGNLRRFNRWPGASGGSATTPGGVSGNIQMNRNGAFFGTDSLRWFTGIGKNLLYTTGSFGSSSFSGSNAGHIYTDATAGEMVGAPGEYKSALTGTTGGTTNNSAEVTTFDASGGAITFAITPTETLVAGMKRILTFVKTDATSNAVTLTGTVNGATNYILNAPGSSVTMQWVTGTSWIIINSLSPAIRLSTTTATGITPTGSAALNYYDVTALATSLTVAAPSGSAVNQNQIILRFTDNSTPRALTFTGGAGGFRSAGSAAIPTTTVPGQTLYVQFMYNASAGMWDFVGSNYATVPLFTVGTASGSLTLSTSDYYTFTGSTATWTLPDATLNAGKAYYIKNKGSGTLTINAASGTQIYTTTAASSTTIAAGGALLLISDGTHFGTN